MKNRKNKWRGKLVTFMFIGVSVFCAFFCTNGFFGVLREDKPVTVEITSGMTGAGIAGSLKQSGVIYSQYAFRAALRLSGKGADIKVGKFEVSPKMSYGKIIETLTGVSNAELTKITVPEGCKLSQVADIMEKNGICTAEEFLTEVAQGEFDYDFLKDIPADDPNRLEGFLFPDTYFIDENSTPHSIINRMLTSFENVYTEDIKAAASGFDMTTREFITLASIIEKEGVGDLDKISSVFHNRLEAPMRLESCATVNYLFDEPKDVLSTEDTWIDSPYNTYRNDGLPPAPICSPGKAAIVAAAFPADTDYLFFIADGEGGNLFSETFEEHKNKKGNR